jgi:integrase
VTAQRDDDLDVEFERVDLPAIREANPIAILDEIAQRRARKYAEKALAPSTLMAYRADWAQFTAWCAVNGYCPLPAKAQVLADYVPEMHEAPSPRRASRKLEGGLRANSIRRRIAAIKYFHKRAGLQSPTDHPIVDDVIAGVMRTKAEEGETIRRVAPIMADTLHTLLDRIGTVSVRDKRDRALLLLCWRSALRRSELAALRRSDLTIRPDAVSVRIRKSKTDQLGAGKEIAVPNGASEARYDLVPALEAWLAVAPESDGESALFPSLHGSKTGAQLSGDAVAKIIQMRCRKAGVAGDFSGHSLRRGWIQSGNASGMTIPDIQLITRQKTPGMVSVYCESEDAFRHARRVKDGL